MGLGASLESVIASLRAYLSTNLKQASQRVVRFSLREPGLGSEGKQKWSNSKLQLGNSWPVLYRAFNCNCNKKRLCSTKMLVSKT